MVIANARREDGTVTNNHAICFESPLAPPRRVSGDSGNSPQLAGAEGAILLKRAKYYPVIVGKSSRQGYGSSGADNWYLSSSPHSDPFRLEPGDKVYRRGFSAPTPMRVDEDRRSSLSHLISGR